MQKNKERSFIAILCKNGLVWIEDVTAPNQKAMWAVLKGEDYKTFSDDFKSLLMAIKAMPEHMFEIYSITTVDGIKKSDIINLYNNNPEQGIKAIRENGYKIYSEYDAREQESL